MLKNIPSNISPELLKILCEMGHGDELVLADGNFPSSSLGKRVIRYDGSDIPELLESILKLFPLDELVKNSMHLMECPEETPKIWNEYEKILLDSGEKTKIEKLERFEFYSRSKEAYVIIATKEKALYSNIILKKGVVKL